MPQDSATMRILMTFPLEAVKDLLDREQSLDLDIERHHGEDGHSC
jgi:hypothetical protein